MSSVPEVTFDDTQTAFASKTGKDLKRARLLMNLLKNPVIGKPGQTVMKGMINVGLPVKPLVKKTLYKQFIGGETHEECRKLAETLGQYHVNTILDYALEGEDNEEEINRALNEFKLNIDFAAKTKYVPVSVFKPSAIASHDTLERLSSTTRYSGPQHEEFRKVRERFEMIFQHARKRDVPVMIDAEESWTQDVIDRLALEMMERYNKEKPLVINTWQLYRKDRLDHLKECYRMAKNKSFLLGAKLVRGAYLEKERDRAREKGYPSPVYDRKEETDRDFNEAIKFCIDHIDTVYLGNATHNEQSCLYAIDLIREKGLPKDHPHIWFSQLYGMSDHITFNLGANGYNAAKYIPYGRVSLVVPYLIRRAEENSSVGGQVARELELIKKELKRRQ